MEIQMQGKQRRPLPLILRYLATMIMVIIVFALYAWFAVPFLEGPSQIGRRESTVATIISNPAPGQNYELSDLFAPGSWELERTKTLATRFGKILFKDYQPKPDGTIHIQPITMILHERRDDGDQALPLVLQSSKGAVLKFDKPIVLGEPVGDLDSGRFLGSVRLWRKSRVNESLEVLVETQNLQFSDQRIYTLEDVAFHFGPHSGSGRHLNIELVGDDLQAQKRQGNSRLKGVKFLEVAKLDQLVLQPAANNKRFETQFQPQEEPPVLVHCNGPFKIDFRSNIASFIDKVLITQNILRDNLQLTDQLSCERMSIEFSSSSPTVQRTTVAHKEKDKWQIDRLIAVGEPAILDFQSRDAKAIAQVLEYDLTNARVIARNSDGHKSIYLRHGKKELESKDIDYHFSEDGSLGTLQSHGPGTLVVRAEKDGSVTRISWTDRIDVRPFEGRKVASIYGGAAVNQTGTSDPTQFSSPTGLPTNKPKINSWRLDCDELHLWLWEVKQSTSTVVGNQKTETAIFPDKFHAKGNVVIASDRLNAETGELKAFWPEPSTTTTMQNMQSRNEVSHTRSVFGQHVSTGLPVRKAVYTANRIPLELSTNKQGVSSPVSKYHVHGDSIQIQMQPYQTQIEVQELTVEGRASLQEYSTEKSDQDLRVEGDQLRWIPKQADLARIIVSGTQAKMAMIRAQGAELFGAIIQLDQEFNKAWITGQGQLHLNRDKGQSDHANSNLSLKQSPQNLSVHWLGGMVFDGDQIYFEQEIKLDGTRISGQKEQSRFIANCHSMTVKLNDSVRFANVDTTADQKSIDIASITLHGTIVNKSAFPDKRTSQSKAQKLVYVRNETRTIDKTNKRMQLTVPSVSIREDLNVVNSEGPGTMMITQSDAMGKMTFMRAEFDREIKGRLDDQYIDVLGNVRIIQADIQHWDEVLSIDHPITSSNHLTRLLADRVQVAKWDKNSQRGESAEFNAVGNAHVTGINYDAEAHRISYDQANEKIVIDGGARSDAKIRYTQSGQSKPSIVIADKITYFKDTQEVDVQHAKRIGTEHRPNQGSMIDQKRK
jgi:lipopolysaccharide export system protein LptA